MSQRFIITQLLGGLGNQMFQYAAGCRLAHDNNLKLLVDDSVLLDHSPGRHEVNRHYDLDIFEIKVKTALPSQRSRFNSHGLSVPGKIVYRFRRALFGDAAYYEKSFRFDEELVCGKKIPRYIAGLWQSYKYFEPISSLIRQDFSFRHVLSDEAKAVVELIAQSGSICLNVRRGDYVSVSSTASILGFVGLDYYRRAVEIIRSRVGNDARFFVFSDDIEWCKRELRWLGEQTFFADHILAGPKFAHYMQIMSSASHFVIPNSTFAWWAAWLSAYKGKTVIAPEAWFSDRSIDSRDLCPPDWIRV